MKKFIFFILVLVSSFTACNTDKTAKELNLIDTLLYKEMPDSALSLLDRIKHEELKTDEDVAYYCLLKTQALYRSYKPILSDSLIDVSIKFYETYSDNDKLARAYYYKGELMCKRKEIDKGIVYTKKAERFISKTDYVFLHHIYETLAFYNLYCQEYKLSLADADKALYYAEKVDNADWILFAWSLKASNFDKLGNNDSTEFCVKRMLPLVSKSNEENRTYILNQIGLFFEKRSPEKTEYYINNALMYNPDAITYTVLGTLQFNKGKKDEAERYMKKAMSIAKGKEKSIVLDVWMQMKMAEGQYKDANNLSLQLMNLSDSIHKADKEQSVREVQTDFDNQIKEEQSRRRVGYVIMGIVCMALIAVALVVYLKYKEVKIRHELVADRQVIAENTRKIMELEQASAAGEKVRAEKEKEIRRLKKDIADIENRHSGLLADGRLRYEEIKGGKTMVTWTKDNFRNFVEYYKLVDSPTVSRLETEYDNLTYKMKAFAILESLKMDDESIAHAMGIGLSTVRTTRSRMSQRRL